MRFFPTGLFVLLSLLSLCVPAPGVSVELWDGLEARLEACVQQELELAGVYEPETRYRVLFINENSYGEPVRVSATYYQRGRFVAKFTLGFHGDELASVEVRGDLASTLKRRLTDAVTRFFEEARG